MDVNGLLNGTVNVSQVNGNVTAQFAVTDLFGALSIILIFALLVGIIYFYEIYKAYQQSQQLLKMDPEDKKVLVKNVSDTVTKLANKLVENKEAKPSDNELKNLNDAINALKNLTDIETTGIQGFTRGQIAISVIFILGAAVILITFSSNPNPSILSNVLSMLGTTLAAVVGFYFGTKKEG